MNISMDMDKSGRVVVPKKMRDALRIGPGTRIKMRLNTTSITIEPEPSSCQMIVENGIPVFVMGYPLPPDHVNWVEQNREARADELFRG